jgi:uncharacterized protein (DUF1697 family)
MPSISANGIEIVRPRTYMALLRGVNVGTANRIAMADLRGALANLGYSDVRTLLNSGNAVFRAAEDEPAAIAAHIRQALAEMLRNPCPVVVLAAEDLARVVAGNPLLGVADDVSRLLVSFTAGGNGVAQLAPLLERDWSPEVLALGEQVAYVWAPNGVIASALATAVGRALGDAVTTRAWTTVVKLDALARGAQER